MDDSIKIGIIVPVYRIPYYMLQECYESLHLQTYHNLEIVFVDDASPDNCGKMCDEFALHDDRVRVIHKNDNQGVSAARNDGIDSIRCDYITFVDGDDWLDLDVLSRVVDTIEGLEKKPDVIIFQQAMDYVGYCEKGLLSESIRIWDTPQKRDELERLALSTALKGVENRITAIDHVSAKLISHDLLKRRNIKFPFIPYREDGVFFQEVVENADIVIEIPVGYHHYRMRGNSAVNRYRANAPEEQKELCNLLWTFAEKYHKGSDYYTSLYSFLLIPMQMSITSYFYNEENLLSILEKHAECRKYFEQEPFCFFYKKVKLRSLKRNARVKAFFIKCHCYGIINYIRKWYNVWKGKRPYV